MAFRPITRPKLPKSPLLRAKGGLSIPDPLAQSRKVMGGISNRLTHPFRRVASAHAKLLNPMGRSGAQRFFGL